MRYAWVFSRRRLPVLIIQRISGACPSLAQKPCPSFSQPSSVEQLPRRPAGRSVLSAHESKQYGPGTIGPQLCSCPRDARRLEDRRVDLLEDGVAVDRHGERLAEDRIGERTLVGLEVEALVVGAEHDAGLDAGLPLERGGQRVGELRVDEVHLTGQQRGDLGLLVLVGHHHDLGRDRRVVAPVVLVGDQDQLALAPRLDHVRPAGDRQLGREVGGDVVAVGDRGLLDDPPVEQLLVRGERPR